MKRLTPKSLALAYLIMVFGLFVGCRPKDAAIDASVGPPVESRGIADQLEQVISGDSVRIEVVDALVTGKDLDGIGAAKGLEILILENTNLTDAGLARLVELPRLVDLRLPRTQVTDRGLKQLAAMPQLERLRLGSPHVTDAGLRHLAGLAHLRSLILVDTPITDAGLEHVQDLPALESFYLQRTLVTDAGVDRLMKYRESQGLPPLHVHW